MKSNTILILILLVSVACETIVEVDFPETEPKLVANCLFSPDSNWRVHVSKSQSILSQASLEITDSSSVTISGSDGTSITLSRQADGWYVGAMDVLPEMEYTLSVANANFPIINATDGLPQPVAIENMDTGLVVDQGFRMKEITADFKDPAGEQNFYTFKLYLLAAFEPGPYSPLEYFEQEVFYNYLSQDIFSNAADPIFDDALFDGKTYQLRVGVDEQFIEFQFGVSEEELEGVDLYLIGELRSVSKNYHHYANSYARYQWTNGDPFAQPVQVFTNVENGFGIFAGYSISRDTIPLN